MGNLQSGDVKPETGERLSGWALLIEDTAKADNTTSERRFSVDDEWEKVEDFQEFEPGAEHHQHSSNLGFRNRAEKIVSAAERYSIDIHVIIF